MLKIEKLGSDELRETASAVETFDDGLKQLVGDMFETMEKADGVGLAGPQVNVSKRLFVVEIPGEVKKAFINPQIVQTSMEEVVMEEGCLSLPGLYREVKRPARVTVQAQDVDGKPFTVTADGLYGRCIQHEFDHLNGVLFIDHLDPEAKEQAMDSYNRKHRFGRRRK